MRKFRSIIIFISVAFIIVALVFINYQTLISKSNLGALVGIISLLLTILAMALSNRHESRDKNHRKDQ